jgi:transcriptional regulator with PAS, ATPase and Fis domain
MYESGNRLYEESGGGVIINTASIASLKGFHTMSAYCAANFVVVGLTRAAAAEYASDKIRINAVCPVSLSRKLDQSKRTIKLLNSKLSKVALAKYSFDNLVGDSPLFMQSIKKAKRASKTDSTVLIIGETGTGKELFAHSIHNCSSRAKKPFIKLNCASIPDNLLESEFFGFEKGSFTGAEKNKVGMFELADDGTIFLDEIGEMSLPLQAKILRVLEEGEMYRIGGVKPIYVDVRIISATNRDLYKLVEQNKFRSDLFYRLNVFNIEIPPLRKG